MKNVQTVAVIAVVLVAALVGVGAYIASFDDIGITLRDVDVAAIDFVEATITLRVTLDLYNPNDAAVELRSADLQAFMQDEYVGAIVSDDLDTTLAGKRTTPVTVNFELENIPFDRLDNELEFRLEGTLDVAVHGIPLPASIDERRSIILF